MTLPIFGKNMAMKEMLEKSREDEWALIFLQLGQLSSRIRNIKLNEEELRLIRYRLNEILSDINKELMSVRPEDSRVPHLSTRSAAERTPDSAD